MAEQSKPVEYPWSAESKVVIESLRSRSEGLHQDEVKERLGLFGKNIFHRQERKSPLSIFFRQFASPLIFILIAAAVVTGFLHEWVEVFVITLAVLVNVGLGFYREYHAEHTLENLSTFIKDRARVVRDNHEQEVDSEILVPGDIIKLAYGSRIPADARILTINNLHVDEAILTGESAPVRKTSDVVTLSTSVSGRTDMVHAGTLVLEGFGTAIVVKTGDHTEIGRIAGLVSGTHRAATPIQKGLSKLAWIIFGLVIVIVAFIFVLGISRGESFFDMLVLAAAISVGAVPESLPIALTVILSIGAERIAKKHGITRTLIAAETLGSTTLIMTDKTGTLTEANMSLVGMHTADDLIKGDEGSVSFQDGGHKLLEMAISNIDVLIENPDDPKKNWKFKGKPFEVNIARTAFEKGMDVSKFTLSDSSSIIIPFNSLHKFSLASYKSQYTVMGAPDVLLSRSKMDAAAYQVIEAWIIKASSEGKRLIALAKSDVAITDVDKVKELTFVGILAFNDPVRKEVPGAVKKIEALGTRIVMITGDLRGTALSVAKEIGWNVSDGEIITGDGLHALSDDDLLKALPSLKIFARVTPEDKLRVGNLYRKLGEVVAMTGDGVNDAPSLKAMDIGVAIGSGSDVAKSAADLVLLDDNFLTISMAIQEGRRILGNIRKTLVYLMSNSLDEVFVVGGSLLLALPLPLTALQIIWVNLFTGSLPALAFAYDEDFDHENPKNHTLTSIFTKEVNILTFGIGVATSLLLFVLYYGLIKFGVELAVARSIFFVCFASYILVAAFSFRSLHKPLFSYPLFSNMRLNWSIVIAVVILILTMSLGVMRDLFGLAKLPISSLWLIVLWLIINVLLVEGAKYIFRKAKRK